MESRLSTFQLLRQASHTRASGTVKSESPGAKELDVEGLQGTRRLKKILHIARGASYCNLAVLSLFMFWDLGLISQPKQDVMMISPPVRKESMITCR